MIFLRGKQLVQNHVHLKTTNSAPQSIQKNNSEPWHRKTHQYEWNVDNMWWRFMCWYMMYIIIIKFLHNFWRGRCLFVFHAANVKKAMILVIDNYLSWALFFGELASPKRIAFLGTHVFRLNLWYKYILVIKKAKKKRLTERALKQVIPAKTQREKGKEEWMRRVTSQKFLSNRRKVRVGVSFKKWCIRKDKRYRTDKPSSSFEKVTIWVMKDISKRWEN